MRRHSLILLRNYYKAVNHLLVESFSENNSLSSKHKPRFKFQSHQGLLRKSVFARQVHTSFPQYSVGIPRPSFDGKNPYLAAIKVNRELHKAGDRSCIHVEFDLEESKVHYEAGDHLVVYPINDSDLVERLGKLCNCRLDETFSLANGNANDNHPLTSLITYRAALTHYLEITAHPNKEVIKELADYCSKENEKELLKLMCSSTLEGEAKYQEWIEDASRNFVHVLEDLPSCRPPIDRICELVPRLQPRFYSISSSSKLHPTTVHITAVLVRYATSTGRLVKGVATSFLSQKHPKDGEPFPRVPVFISKSLFHLPENPETPIIMVGLGTGIAPFRGFIQERHLLREKGRNVGDSILYFGCRKRSEDYIYEDELEEYAQKGSVQLRLAFSRDQPEKVYVTHLLVEDADFVWKIIDEQKGSFYVCGDAKNMAAGVRNVLLNIIKTKGKLSDQEAEQYIEKMTTDQRYLNDEWLFRKAQ